MVKHVAISVLGKDQPGIVAAVSKTLFETGCNIEDSSMTSLGCEFAMIVIVALPGRISVADFEKKMSAMARQKGLSASLRVLKEAELKPCRMKGNPFVLSVYGADKPGIVYTISDFLAKKHINITDVQTNIIGAGKSKVYVMFLEIDLPSRVSFMSLKASLLKIADALKVTVTLNPVESAEL